MKGAHKRDQMKRLNFIRNEIKRNIIKSIYSNKYSENWLKYKFYFKFLISKSSKNCSLIQLHNFCNFTSRSHSVLRFFGVERFTFKMYSQNGLWNYLQYSK